MRLLKFTLGTLLAAFSISTYAQDCIVIVMHGKWGGPKSPYLKVLADKNLILVKGSVPGAKGSTVLIAK